MFNSQKFLLVLSAILFVVFASEIFYIFFYQPSLSKKTAFVTPTPVASNRSVTPIPTPITPAISNKIVGMSSFVFDEKLATQSGDQVQEYILAAQKSKHNFISLNNMLQAVIRDPKKCTLDENCYQSNNDDEKNWKGDFDVDFPVFISGPFLIRLNITGNKEPSGISLKGKLSKSNIWWEEVREIFIGIGGDGKRLYIDARNNSPDSYLLYENFFDKKIDGLYILFNNRIGSSFLITDLSYNKIAFINVNETTRKRFPADLFPDRRFYVGYGIAPSSDLIVNDFSIL